MNSNMNSFMSSVTTFLSSCANPLVLVAAMSLRRYCANGLCCPIPTRACFAGRNGCFRVTYTCDKHMYHECILYIYMKPFSRPMSTGKTATLQSYAACRAVHMCDCKHVMLRCCQYSFFNGGWITPEPRDDQRTRSSGYPSRRSTAVQRYHL